MITPLAPADGDAVLPLADARVHLKLTADDADLDDQVVAARAAAVSIIEVHTGKALQSRQFVWSRNRFSPNMRPPVGPVSSVDAIDYLSGAGTLSGLQPGGWTLAGDYLVPAGVNTWPLGGASVKVTLTAGYANAGAIPSALLVAVKLAMTALFDDRSNPDLSAALAIADRFRRRVV